MRKTRQKILGGRIMQNEIVEAKQDVVVDECVNYNKKTGEIVIPISIKVKRVKTDKANFKAVSGLMYLSVIEDGIDTGEANRWLNIHFTKEAFSDAAPECDIKSIEDLSTGTLYVKAKGVQAPSRYEVKVDAETGELEYPVIWIRGGIMGFEPYVVSADKFAFHKKEKVQDAQVNEATFDVSSEN